MARMPNTPRKIKAIQVITVQHPEGGDGLVILDASGTVYAHTDKGWVALDMIEAFDGN